MKIRWWYGIVLNLMLAALVIGGAAVYITQCKGAKEKTGLTLEIIDDVSGKTYGAYALRSGVEEGGDFAIEFFHSVNQSPVRETFKIESGMIRPFSVRFSSFGAGMKNDLDEGELMCWDADEMLITGFNASYGELNYIVGSLSDHLLHINGEVLSLQGLCGPNAHITLRVRR